jgi:hypothetical protein
MRAELEPTVWSAIIYPYGVTDILGAIRASPRLYWTASDAQSAAEAMMAELKLTPIETWENIEDGLVIARAPRFFVLLRRFILPRGARRPR